MQYHHKHEIMSSSLLSTLENDLTELSMFENKVQGYHELRKLL